MKKTTASKKYSIQMPEKEIIKAAMDLGAKGARIVAPRRVATGHWVRWKCAYGCNGYQSSLMCPPYTPTPDRTREMLDQYKRALLFEANLGEPKKIALALENKLFLRGFYKAFGLGAGSCHLCKACAFEKGCRKPQMARPSMESCGIDVFTTARRHGFTINVVQSHEDFQHYFGLVLID